MQLTCPKCQASMRQYERNGVHIDQCTECRGIFLDRGELERLTDAENEWHSSATATAAAAGAPAPQPAPQPYRDYRGFRDSDDRAHGGYRDHGGHQQQGYGHKKKRKNFFEELFD